MLLLNRVWGPVGRGDGVTCMSIRLLVVGGDVDAKVQVDGRKLAEMSASPEDLVSPAGSVSHMFARRLLWSQEGGAREENYN